MNRLAAYFSLGVIGQTPIPGIPLSLPVSGNLIAAADLIPGLTALDNFAIAGARFGYTTSAGATITLTALQNLFQRLTNGGAVTVTIDSAYNIVNSLQNPFNGMIMPFSIVATGATTVATPTLSDTAVTLAGTTSVLAGAWRQYAAQITQLSTTTGTALTSGSTWVSLAQVGSTNNYTVTLGTNAISPTVGNVIYLGVTAGTLPPGWYSINKVTSATSFVIAAPVAGTAWTATAVTLPGTTTVPVSQYTPGLPGVYSPTLTVTGVMASVTATFTV